MRFLIFDTQISAQDAVDTIDSKGRLVYSNAGFTLDAEGNVIGQLNGVDNPTAVTSTWYIPRQRTTDQKWVVLHPENFNMADYEVSPGVLVKDYVMDGITAPIEEQDDSWFPIN